MAHKVHLIPCFLLLFICTLFFFLSFCVYVCLHTASNIEKGDRTFIGLLFRDKVM